MRVMFAHYVARGVPVALVYSVRSEADAVFLPEFAQVGASINLIILTDCMLDVHLLI